MEPKYRNTTFQVSNVLTYLLEQNPTWAIPEIQRPFVWDAKKVRSLIASMFLGFPVGSVMIWKGQGVRARLIGQKKKVEGEVDLVIDGQQRLTSIKILFEGGTVATEKGDKLIRIQFNPLIEACDGSFEVLKAAKPKAGWAIVSEAFSAKSITDYIAEYKKVNKSLSREEMYFAEKSLVELSKLTNYSIGCIEIFSNVDIDEAAEIFVRINSTGTPLKQGDFIMTLLELGNSSIKTSIQSFVDKIRKSTHARIFQPKSGDILSSLVSYTMREATGKKVYDLLKGKVGKGVIDKKVRDANMTTLAKGVDHICDSRNWDEFMEGITAAGMGHSNLIISETALNAAYSIYTMMARKAKPAKKETRQRAIGRWLYFCTITNRYTSHTDSVTRKDVNAFYAEKTGECIAKTIDAMIDAELSSTYWDNVDFKDIPDELLTIALAQQKAPVLFSKILTVDECLRNSKPGEPKVEIHHLFPTDFMDSQQGTQKRTPEQTNIGANKAPISASENSTIGSNGPSSYVPTLKKNFTNEEWSKQCRTYALPDNWEAMCFDDFITARSKLLPGVIRKSLDALRTS